MIIGLPLASGSAMSTGDIATGAAPLGRFFHDAILHQERQNRMPLAFEIFVVVTKWVVLVAIAHSLYLTLLKSKE